jgi:hypothetical protein
MTTRLAPLLIAPLLLIACGGDDTSGGGGSGGEATSHAATTGAGAGATTGTGAGGSGTGSGGGGPSTLFPLAVGYRWTYDVAPVGGGSVCGAGQHEAEVVGSGPLAGKDAFELTNWCTGAGGNNQYAPGDGDQVFFYYSGDWLTALDVPVEEGHTWDYFNTSFTWHNAGPVTVPAGTFEDCWTATQNVAYTAYSTYCRGVGLTRSYSADLNGAGWDAQLVSTSGL